MSRTQILEAAAQIFSQKGYHGASMQDIAEAVHLQKASLYHHVASKQEILFDILNLALDLLIARMQNVLDQPLSPDEKLRQAMRVYLESMLDHRELAAVLLLEYRSLEPELYSPHISRRDDFERLWRDLILEGNAQSIFNFNDAAVASKALLGVMNWTITWYRPDGALSVGEIADQFADLFLDGLLARMK